MKVSIMIRLPLPDFLRIYIDGTGYDFGADAGTEGHKMSIAGGVFGSGGIL